MAHDPMNPGRPRYVGPRRENYMTWLLGALAAIGQESGVDRTCRKHCENGAHDPKMG